MKHLPIFQDNFKKHLHCFSIYLRTKGYSSGKDSFYINNVHEFLFFIENRNIQLIQDVTASEIIAYHNYLKIRPNQRMPGYLCDSTIKKQLFALRIFFDYMLDIGEIEKSPAHLPKFVLSSYKGRDILTTEEIRQLFNACTTRQDKALISLAYGCGLRRSELEKLNISDVFLQLGVVIVRDGKFHKKRTVPMSGGVLKYMKEYIIFERANFFHGINFNEKALFVNSQGSRLLGEIMNERLKILIQNTGNKRMIAKEITLHSLRHSISTHLLDNGAPIEFVQQFLGHTNIDTVLIYVKKRKQRQKILNQIKYEI